MPSNTNNSDTNNSAPQSPEFAPPSPARARKSFFGTNYQSFKDQIASFVSHQQEKGTTEDRILRSINEYIQKEINQLRKDMTEDGNTPEEIQEVVENKHQQLHQIVEEIMKDRCLQSLKKECEAIIAEEQEKKTAPEHIKKQVRGIINNKLQALYEFHKTAGDTPEEAKQKIKNLHPVIQDLIRPLLTKIQESKQKNYDDAQFIKDTKNGYEGIIAKHLKLGMLPGEIAIFIRENMEELSGIKRNFIPEETPPQEIEEAVRVFNLQLKEAVAPLLEKLQKENTVVDLSAMNSLQISNIPSPTGGASPSPAGRASPRHSSPDMAPNPPRLKHGV